MAEISERLKAVRGNVSQTEFAQIFGLHRNTLVKYETGTQLPTTDFITQLCNKYNISSDWLLFGVGSKERIGLQPDLKDNVVSCADNTDIDMDNYCFIPMVEARLSGGNGEPVYSEGVKDYYAFRRPYINYIATSPKNLVLMRVSGNSMEPEIQNGGTVMIDMGRKHPKSGCYFALGFDDALSVKELDLMPGGRVRVISKNRTDYPPYDADLKDIRIIGQVIWGDRAFPI